MLKSPLAGFNPEASLAGCAGFQFVDHAPDSIENPRWILWENLGGGKFAEHIILDQKLGGHELQAGDVDHDGDIDICSKAWGPLSWNGAGGRMHVDYLENRLR